MSIRHVLQSLLVRQSMALGEAWDGKYPHDWLIWEAGAARPSTLGVNVSTTQVPNGVQPAPGGPDADSLCFELVAQAGKVRIGRALQNDIVIPDATVSREHLVLEKAEGRWLGSALPSSRATKFSVDREPVTEDGPMPLRSGDRVTLGSVTLTYLSASALKARVQAEAKRLMR